MLKWFGRPITCPYCLASVRAGRAPDVCRSCKQELPVQYAEGSAAQTPLFVQVFGWSGVGKTVFLQAMTLMLVKMGKVWPDYSYAALNDIAQSKVSNIQAALALGMMPPATQKGEQEVYIMALRAMERWGERILVTRDCPGEAFNTMRVPLSQVPYLLKAPTTLMLVGPRGDCSNAGGRSCDQLLNNYINTLLSLGVDFARDRRKIVVVLTKADQIPDLPTDLRVYLMRDPLWAAVSGRGSPPPMDAAMMENYILTMEHMSGRIGAWLAEDAAGTNFLRLAAMRNIELRFALISSTGEHASTGATPTSGIAPRRVLDPYFWALELQSA